jgi:hypothetical protein
MVYVIHAIGEFHGYIRCFARFAGDMSLAGTAPAEEQLSLIEAAVLLSMMMG